MENSVFIGFDRREILPWHVLCHSILARSSKPVSISAVKLSQLPLSRPVQGSTEFSISRFMVPWMCGYKGLALFMDCDILVRCDVAELFALHDGSAVQVVQHDYTPKTQAKFYGNFQRPYPKKNWSSVMLFDCAQCTALTPQYVNTCYTLTAPDYGFSIAGLFEPNAGAISTVKDSVTLSPTGAPEYMRRTEAEFAYGWLKNIAAEAFL